MSETANGVLRRRGQMAGLELDRALGAGAFGADMRDIAADHHAGQRSRGLLARIAGARHLAVAQNGGAVADALHLFQPVADIENRAALGLQLVQRFEQPVGFLRRQHRGRLVENDQLRILQQCADDLDTLAFADGQVGHMRMRIERQAIGMRQIGRLLGDPCQRDARIHRQGDVFGDGQRLEQRKMLEHHADAELARRTRAGDAHRLSLPDDLAAGRREHAEQHLDQRRFAGAVFAEQRMDFARPDIEIDSVTGRECAEQFCQLANSQQ